MIISASDEMCTASQELAYKSYSPKAKECIGRISTHTYDISGIDSLGELAKKEGFNLWMSEVDGGGVAGENAGEMSAALWLAKKIIFDMNRLNPSAWVLWQVIDSHICAAGFMDNHDRCMPDILKGYWGLAVCDHDREEIILTQKYYAMGQFSKFIRPGDRIVSCEDDSFLAAYNPTSGNVAVVAINSDSDPKFCHIDFSEFGEFSNIRAVRTSGNSKFGEKWHDVDCTNVQRYVKGFGVYLKPNSITTFIFER
ncbi:MAG: hypothetical protein IJ424_05950 [Oscillospiraceae bacterium]|nr:hypothetical protein [Oscillospiraceae bacterium]